MKQQSIRYACWVGFVAAAGASSSAEALSFDATLRARTAFEANGARDLGLNNGSNTNIAYLNLSPRLFITFTPKFTGFLRGLFFAPTDEIAVFDDGQPEQPQTTGTFAVLNEAWLEYKGLTSYPGESVRVGRQLIREGNSEWIGQNIDGVRWSVDTTLFRASAAVMYQFSSYRTDDQPIPPNQRDHLYGAFNVSGDWSPGQRIGGRVLHSADQKGIQPSGTLISDSSNLQSGQLTWIGIYADNGFNDVRTRQSLYYSFDLTYLTGTNFTAETRSGAIASVSRAKLGAFAGTGALRWKPFVDVPVSFGTAYTLSQGGGNSQYQQSGLQNNNNYFTGTLTLSNRYNEVVRAQLGNLHIVTAFVSYSLGDYEAAVVYENFKKDDVNAPITTNNISARTNTVSKDVGNGMDLVLTRYVGNRSVFNAVAGDDDSASTIQRSSLRLRASMFDPGAAYGAGVKNFDYRIVLETTLWLF